MLKYSLENFLRTLNSKKFLGTRFPGSDTFSISALSKYLNVTIYLHQIIPKDVISTYSNWNETVAHVQQLTSNQNIQMLNLSSVKLRYCNTVSLFTKMGNCS
jgi:hypothetical protein